jgi:hypothetical protein
LRKLLRSPSEPCDQDCLPRAKRCEKSGRAIGRTQRRAHKVPRCSEVRVRTLRWRKDFAGGGGTHRCVRTVPHPHAAIRGDGRRTASRGEPGIARRYKSATLGERPEDQVKLVAQRMGDYENTEACICTVGGGGARLEPCDRPSTRSNAGKGLDANGETSRQPLLALSTVPGRSTHVKTSSKSGHRFALALAE